MAFHVEGSAGVAWPHRRQEKVRAGQVGQGHQHPPGYISPLAGPSLAKKEQECRIKTQSSHALSTVNIEPNIQLIEVVFES